MPGLTVKALFQDIKKLETEALIVGFYENVRPLKGLAGELDWLLCGSLSKLIIKNRLQGRIGDAGLLTSGGKVPAQKIFLVGLGRTDHLSPEVFANAARTAIATAINAGVKQVAIECFPIPGMAYDASVPALVRGLTQGAAGKPISISVLSPDAAAHETISRFISSAA